MSSIEGSSRGRPPVVRAENASPIQVRWPSRAVEDIGSTALADHRTTSLAPPREFGTRSKAARTAPTTGSDASARRRRYLAWRNGIERGVAAVMLAPCSLLIGICVLLVRFTSRGPGIYRQVRVGRGNKPFTMYKIRTMREDAEAATGPVWSTGNDPRVTRVGRFLRWTHLDELPQLLNILQGQMSFIGPRPERPEFVERLRARLPHYDARFSLLPGVTGLAQICRPADSNVEDVRQKLVLEIVYLRHVCLWLDIRILARTVPHVLGIRPAATKH